mmetsp:Transcript_53699/g.142326  ORF Transcript_53699/g.142326 Transcript_53699/m.142326 type:complete len:142 (+) Transcript_53699:253-678(+)
MLESYRSLTQEYSNFLCVDSQNTQRIANLYFYESDEKRGFPSKIIQLDLSHPSWRLNNLDKPGKHVVHILVHASIGCVGNDFVMALETATDADDLTHTILQICHAHGKIPTLRSGQKKFAELQAQFCHPAQDADIPYSFAV